MILLVFFQALLFFFLVLFNVFEATKNAHWTDFVPKNEGDDHAGHDGSNPPNDSHKVLNEKSKNPIQSTSAYFQAEIPLGHTNRRKVIPLIHQRNQYEGKVNDALIGGIIFRKTDNRVSQSLFNYALEQRQKSQRIQRRMDHIKAEGYVDPKKERLLQKYDRMRQSRINRGHDPDYYSAKLKRQRENSSQYWQRKKKNIDLNLPPSNNN